MKVLFVTGTDTEVGKTVVTAALAATLLAEGRSVAVVKPAQTGVAPDEPGDLAEVRRLAGDVDCAEGVRLRLPLAPDTAARLEGASLPDICAQRDLVLDAARTHDLVLLEGAGGITVRLGEAWGLLDLAELVAEAGATVSFVVVARPGLGTLNHTALTVDAITARGRYVEGLVLGSWPDRPDLAMEQNLLDLPALTGVPVVGRVPEGAGSWPGPRFAAAAPGWIVLPAE